ncbi:hypothetical protein C2857_006909 [Epichloe festucae Fl1]|uniref:Uncharacterized protein n=1 Tax=Epichloe festucae (strain Fl1) TaxID=877507 RepID=A0A7S9KM23_EPIFF|nr:hypothetical protein C2857_006909 [Epichloe festucae Fl1]
MKGVAVKTEKNAKYMPLYAQLTYAYCACPDPAPEFHKIKQCHNPFSILCDRQIQIDTEPSKTVPDGELVKRYIRFSAFV